MSDKMKNLKTAKATCGGKGYHIVHAPEEDNDFRRDCPGCKDCRETIQGTVYKILPNVHSLGCITGADPSHCPICKKAYKSHIYDSPEHGGLND